jgi:hypothetical protein
MNLITECIIKSEVNHKKSNVKLLNYYQTVTSENLIFNSF